MNKLAKITVMFFVGASLLFGNGIASADTRHNEKERTYQNRYDRDRDRLYQERINRDRERTRREEVNRGSERARQERERAFRQNIEREKERARKEQVKIDKERDRKDRIERDRERARIHKDRDNRYGSRAYQEQRYKEYLKYKNYRHDDRRRYYDDRGVRRGSNLYLRGIDPRTIEKRYGRDAYRHMTQYGYYYNPTTNSFIFYFSN